MRTTTSSSSLSGEPPPLRMDLGGDLDSGECEPTPAPSSLLTLNGAGRANLAYPSPESSTSAELSAGRSAESFFELLQPSIPFLAAGDVSPAASLAAAALAA